MRLAVGVLVMSGMVIGITADAMAHGGSHATPWPTPTTSTYSYTPTTYFPTYYPTPPPGTPTTTTPVTPTGPTTSPTTPGQPTPGGNPTNPTGPTGPTGPNTQPSGPTGPNGPTSSTPSGPSGPQTGPGGPSSTPTGPQAPTAPTGPTGGPTGGPSAPTAPGAPTSGGGPSAPTGQPTGPTGPTSGTPTGSPTGPGSPTQPGGTPTGPVAPTNPTGPNGNPNNPTGPGSNPTTPPTGGNPYGPTTGGPGQPNGPTGGPAGGPQGPAGPTGPGRDGRTGRKAPSVPTKQQRAQNELEAKQQWMAWWHLNQWRFLRSDGNRAVTTGKDADVTNQKLVDFLTTKALKDRHFDPKSAACIALGKMGVTKSRTELEKLVLARTEKNYVRESAALALGMMGAHPSAGLLTRIAGDARFDDALRVNAVIGLGLLRDPSHVNTLLQIITRRDDQQVHTAAAIALGLIGDKAAVSALNKVAMAYGMNPSVRSAAINALGKTAPGSKDEAKVFKNLRRLVQSDNRDDVRRAAALVLYRFTKARELNTTLDRVIRNDRDDVTAGFAMISLAEAVHARGDSRDRQTARGLFQAKLQGGSKTIQGYAAIALGLLGRSDRECAKVLRPVLTQSGHDTVRAAVAIGLGLCEDIGSRDALGRLAMGRAQQDLRGYACVALGMLAAKSKDAGISKYLTEIVENVNIPEVKAAAALALSKIGSSPEAVDTLRKALNDRNRYFKMSAIIALGYFRDHGTVKDFTDLYTRENNYEVRALSVVALGYIGEDAKVPVLRQISMDFNHLSVFQKQMDAMNIILGLF